MTKWGYKSRALSRASVIALISSLFVAIPLSSASATDYPPCTIQGTQADETLNGTDGNDVICTGGGNDIVLAGAGDDIVIAENGGSVDVDLGTGNDIFDGTNGSDAVVDGGSGDDELTGTPGSDELNGDEGDDTLVGGESSDTLNGGLGADELSGSAGADNLNGGDGNDVIDGGDGSDFANGDAGDDSLVGGSEGDTIHGGDGNDNLVGDAGPDNLFGDAGTDSLNGGHGDDIIVGGDGVDSLDGGFGLNICDYTTLEPRTSTCTYDDEGPAVSGFFFDQPSYEVGAADAQLRVEFDASDATGISWITGICWGNNTNTYPLNFQVSFDDAGTAYYWGENGVTGSMVGDRKSAHYVLDLKIKFGTKPGTYECYMYGRDTAMHMSNWAFQSKLEVTRTGGTYDDEGPAVSGFFFDQPSYEVGAADAQLRVEFDASDATGISWITGICWGNNTNTYPLNFQVSFDDAGTAYYWGENGVTGSMVGDRKSAHYVLDLKIKFGTKPGTYECYMYGRDTAMHMSNWAFQSKLEVTRTGGTYDDEGPAVSGFFFDQPSYEVGAADAQLRVEFDASDATGISWITGICWGNNTNTYPLNFQVSFDDAGTAYYWGENGVTGSMVGDRKSAHYVLDLKIKFGTKPGTYECYMYGRDTAMHMSNWAFQSKLHVFRTPPGMPDAPTSLQLIQDRPGRGVLSWAAPKFLGSPALKDYVIQVSEDGQIWKDLVDGYSTTTNLPLDNLKNDTDYWFRVRGENGGAAGANTDYMVLNWGQLQVHTLAARVPDAPTDLVISTVSANGFNLAWSAPTFDGGKSITDFTVEVSTDSGATWRSAKADASTSLSYSVRGASPGTNYLVRVAAKNDAGLSSYLEGSLRTLATIPGAPQNLNISKVSYRTLTLGWSLPSSNGGSAITNYKIEFSSNGGTTWTEISHPVSASRSFNVTGLTRGKSYKFRVSAINVVGVGMAATPVSATTLLATASAPQSLTTANVTSESADLSWTAPSDNGGASITRYNIEISSNGGTTWFNNGWTIGTKPQWYFAPLNPGTTYTYRVTPVTKAGSGANSTGTFTTLAVLPQAPRNAKVSEITNSGLTISWSLPLSNGGSPILDYLVEMSSDGGGTWKPVAHTASNNLALKVTGLPAGTKRWFRVSTVTAVGTSEAFTSTSAVTLGNAPAAPTAVKVSSRTSTTVTIIWSQAQVVGGSPVRNFVIEYSKDGGSTWLTAKSVVTKAQSSTISGFKSGTNYKIRVRAVNDVGSSAASTFVSVTTR